MNFISWIAANPSPRPIRSNGSVCARSLAEARMLGTRTAGRWSMSVDPQRHLRLGLVLVLILVACACSAADKENANFSRAQKLRKDASVAARQGDTASALEDIDQVQMLEPRTSRSPGLTPPPLSVPEDFPIAPAGGYSVTCYNIGINRFSCF
jgi:hypothetical protein